MLRSFNSGRPDVAAPFSASLRFRRSALLMLTASAFALGGCSADFLRFDSPAFNFNDSGSAEVSPIAERNGDYAPTGASLVEVRRETYDSGTGMAPAGYGRAATSQVRGGAAPSRVMAGAQREQLPRRQYAEASPLSTGALGGQRADTITVARGDTLYQLARRYGVSVAALRDANNLSGHIIRPGQMLVVPAPGAAPRVRAPSRVASRPLATPLTRTPVAGGGGRIVTVAPGDSLYAISRRTGVSVDQLKQINAITDVRRLRPGMKLRLDGGAPGTARVNAVPQSVVAQAERPVSRTDFGQTAKIKAKPIRTVSIGRELAPAASTPPANASQPRILNGGGRTASAPGLRANPANTAAVQDQPVKFRWPAKGRIIATFNNSGKGVRNDGINISLPIGTPIEAVDNGVVAYAGSELKGYGRLVLLRHDNGWVSAYAHASEVLVKRGDKVTKGQVVAKAGRSGGVTQPQLHFELRRDAQPVDPLPHLAQM